MDERLNLLIAYFKQQAQLEVPPYIFSDSFSLSCILGGNSSAPRSTVAAPSLSRRFAGPAAQSRQMAMPLPAQAFIRKGQSFDAPAGPHASEKRTKLAHLFRETKACQQCGLGKLRTSFVFGTGNPDALFMVIGEAPGEEEDRQGQPFVGAAGDLLTKMLAAIEIDRTKHAFISNVIKCRPPENRNPDPVEIQACSGLLARQIGIIGPKVLLLLGRTASHALLGSTESIASLRERNGRHFYKNIPSFVTYHPAALLRNDSYRRPAWEDLKKLKLVLKDSGAYDVSAQ
jgi:uracil-DNA glycosylase